MSKSANVKVYCRIRPENEKEKASGMKVCITPTSENSVKILTESVGVDTGKDSSKNKSENFQTFTYDSVFSAETEQEVRAWCFSSWPILLSFCHSSGRSSL